MRSTNRSLVECFLFLWYPFEGKKEWRNKYERIPESIRNLRCLAGLSLAEDQLPELPEWIADFEQLESLNISSNRIEGVPEWIARLQRLYELSQKSRIVNHSPWLTTLPLLGVLNIAGNPIESRGVLDELQSKVSIIM